MRIGKRGDDTGEAQTNIYFLAFELLLGIIVLVGLGFYFVDALPDNEGIMTAKDLGLVIETVSSIPYDIYYNYPVNTEELRIEFGVGKDNYLDVYGKGPTASYQYLLMPGVKTQKTQKTNEVVIPVIKRGNEIFFSTNPENTIVKNKDCNKLLQILTQQPSITFTVNPASAGSERVFIQNIFQSLESINNIQDNSLKIKKSGGDITINVGFNKQSDSLVVEYDESVQGYERMACYLRTNIAKGGVRFDSVEEKPSTSKNINIFLGSYKKLQEEGAKDAKYLLTVKDAYALNLLAAVKGGLDYG